ncbi:hypothetical protein LY28_02268 [Ruminiclostridium sufflavum DSM 19573]|uniref:Uncharacterized protein n=1 Tax=Ruminiclostridium sufflavum DSM 19573 TaxID=1121337 RepID=A0A318XJF8_9FIRM|nr:hypothetical protein [Ruminiclostridium sufflavum]PYG87134.1 hypothetical protein LY28_02268 [Ruminiclostridium sufflavum DSM 19573]
MAKYSKKFFTLTAVFLITSMVTVLFFSGVNVKAYVFGSKYYYLYLERDNLKELKNTYKEYYKEKNLSENSYECSAKAKLDGDLMKYDEEMKTAADYLCKLNFNIKYNSNNKDLKNRYYTLYLGADYNNKEFVDIDIKSADDKLIIALPSLTEKTVGMDYPETTAMTADFINAFLDDDKAFEKIFGLSRADYDCMVERYLKNAVFDQIPENKVVFSDDSNYENIKCNSITFNIDKEVIANIYKALAKELENDKDIRTLCYSVSRSFMEFVKLEEQEIDYEEPSIEEIDEEIKNMCENLKEKAENIEDIQLAYTAYFKNSGDIISRQLNEKENGTSVILSRYKDLLGNDIFSFNVKDNQDSVFEIKNTMRLQSGIYNGQCNLDLSGRNLFKAAYTYEKDAKVGGLDAFVGDIEGKISMEALEDMEYSSADDSPLSDIYFNFSNKRTDNDILQGKAAFTSQIDGKRMGISIFTQVKQSNTAGIDKPDMSFDKVTTLDDEEGMEAFTDDISESFQEKIIGLILSDSLE